MGIGNTIIEKQELPAAEGSCRRLPRRNSEVSLLGPKGNYPSRRQMRKIELLMPVLIVLLSSCVVLDNKSSNRSLYARIVNVDTISTHSYMINGCNFPGLNPGDTTDYQLLKKLNMGDEFSVTIGTSTYSTSISDCSDCDIKAKKVTIAIRIIPKGQMENNHIPLINVRMISGD